MPAKRAEGRTKTRLALDAVRAPVVAKIFTWRVDDRLGLPTITARLNADHAACPPPKGDAWTARELQEMGRAAGFAEGTVQPLPPSPQTMIVFR